MGLCMVVWQNESETKMLFSQLTLWKSLKSVFQNKCNVWDCVVMKKTWIIWTLQSSLEVFVLGFFSFSLTSHILLIRNVFDPIFHYTLLMPKLCYNMITTCQKIKLGKRSDANGPKTTYHENLLDLTCKSDKDAMRHRMTLTMKIKESWNVNSSSQKMRDIKSVCP